MAQRTMLVPYGLLLTNVIYLFPSYVVGLHEPNKHIIFTDLPLHHTLFTDIENSERQRADHISNVEFEDALEKRREIAQKDGELTSKREQYMVEQLPRVVSEVIQEHLYLGLKNKLNIFIALGSTYTQMSHLLKKEGNIIEERKFQEEDYSFGGYSRETARRVIFNKPISEELLARTVIEYLFMTYYGSGYCFLVDNALDVHVLSRVLIAPLSTDEMKQCCDVMRTNVKGGFKGTFEGILCKKGILFCHKTVPNYNFLLGIKEEVTLKA